MMENKTLGRHLLIIVLVSTLLVSLTASTAIAQQNNTSLTELEDKADDIQSYLLTAAQAIGGIVLVWGLILYFGSKSPQRKESAKWRILGGAALIALGTIWSIVQPLIESL